MTATPAPVFGAELARTAVDRGLPAGAHCFGFAAPQRPLRHALDRDGPQRTLLALLAAAVLGCAGYALARGLPQQAAADARTRRRCVARRFRRVRPGSQAAYLWFLRRRRAATDDTADNRAARPT